MSFATLPVESTADLLAQIDALPAFALEATLERFMDDREFLCLAVTTCLQQAPGMLDALQAAVAKGDSAGSAASAHGLKGAVGTCGAERVAAIAARIEHVAKCDDMAVAAALLAPLHDAFEAYRLDAALRLSL